MRWTQRRCADEALLKRTAKSCGPDASTPASSFGGVTRLSDGDKKARSPGRARSKLLKPLRAGMPGNPGEPVVTTARVHSTLFCTRGCGCIGRPAFPTPLVGRKINAQLGRFTPRECGVMFSTVIAREGGRSSIPEAVTIESRSRGVLDAPPSRGMTTISVERSRTTLASSLRKQRPITTGHGVMRKASNSVFQNKRHGVWVPAFAGTTLRDTINARQSPAPWSRAGYCGCGGCGRCRR
jgi:hypothetical protein